MGPASERSHRSALVLSTMLTLVGSCGACNGTQRYASPPPPTADAIAIGEPRGAEQTAALYAEIGETYFGSPDQKPLGIANLVVSMMLVAGGFMLGARRPSTVWFLTNALIANLVFIVADHAVTIRRVLARSGTLAHRLADAIVAQAPPTTPIDGPTALAQATSMVYVSCFLVGVVAAAKFGFHAMLIRRARSEEIAEFLASEPDES